MQRLVSGMHFSRDEQFKKKYIKHSFDIILKNARHIFNIMIKCMRKSVKNRIKKAHITQNQWSLTLKTYIHSQKFVMTTSLFLNSMD